MTLVLAYVDRLNRRTHMAGDSSVLDGTAQEVLEGGKVWTAGEMMLGAAGGLRTLQVARYLFQPPDVPSAGFDGLTYMVTQFIPAWFKACGEHNELRSEAGAVRKSGGNLLVALRGRLYTVDDHFSVTCAVRDFAAIGCAREAAEASVLTALDLAGQSGVHLADVDVRPLLEAVLTACSQLSTAVSAPFHHFCLEAEHLAR
jgi:hypothetical protein